MTTPDLGSIRPLQDSLKKSQHLPLGVVLHMGQARLLDTDIITLP